MKSKLVCLSLALAVTTTTFCQNSYIAADLNTIGAQGAVIESAGASPANGPNPDHWYTGINFLANSNPAYTVQLGASYDGRLWTRRSDNSQWNNWKELLTTGNFNAAAKADRGFDVNKDFNSYTSPGLYEFDGLMPNAPNGSPNFRVLSLGNDGRWTQMAFQWDDNRVFFRRKIDEAFIGWYEFYHTGNFNPSNYLPLTGGSVNGDLYIGNTGNQSKLDVNGTIKARKIKVTQTDWPDYVFDSSYKLLPLARIEDFIKQNKHLPEVPSASDVAESGLNLGENQSLLLKKIEELTLYLIHEQKQRLAVEIKMKEQEEKINTLQQQLEKLLNAPSHDKP